jgi:hypothetical protein
MVEPWKDWVTGGWLGLVVGSGHEVQVGFGLCHLVASSHMSLEVATVGEKMLYFMCLPLFQDEHA